MTNFIHTTQRCRTGLVGPANAAQAVGNSQVLENDPLTSLGAMWTAYRRSRLESAENCPICRTKLRLVALVLVYRIKTPTRKAERVSVQLLLPLMDTTTITKGPE